MKTNTLRVSTPFILRMALACQTVSLIYRQSGKLFGDAAATEAIKRINASGHSANEHFIRSDREYSDPEALVYILTGVADDETEKELKLAELLGRVFGLLTDSLDKMCNDEELVYGYDHYDIVANAEHELGKKLGIYFQS